MYLKRCLDSVLKQDCKFKYEVIAVDDCSTDSSLDILRKYELSYPNFKVITHEKNMKLSCARISGIKESNADFIVHLDSDDWIIANGLNILGNEIQNGDFDIYLFNYFRSNSSNELEKICLFKNSFFPLDKHLIKNKFLGTCWNKVVKRDLHEHLIYGQTGVNSEEDLLYCLELFLKSNKFKCCDNYYYIYYKNSSSITMSVNPIDFLSSKPIILKEIYQVFSKYQSPRTIQSFVIDYFEKWIYIFVFRIHVLGKNQKEIFNQLLEDLSNIKEFEKKRYVSIKNSTSYLSFAFYQVLLRFGYKIAISILLSKYKQTFRKNFK